MATDYQLKVIDTAVSLQTDSGTVPLRTIPGRMVEPPAYEGEYVVTPSNTAQTLETAGKLVARNITINPIPSNYGLIAWNGSVLTVS